LTWEEKFFGEGNRKADLGLNMQMQKNFKFVVGRFDEARMLGLKHGRRNRKKNPTVERLLCITHLSSCEVKGGT
jgi:hypothetical protein